MARTTTAVRPALALDATKLRAWWAHRQGLDDSLRGAPASQVLERTGWSRSVGGVGPYLTLFSRAGIGRANADRAVASLEIHELPAARGCTYVVPRSEFAIAIEAGAPFGEADLRTAAKLGVTPREIERLCEAVLRALARGPLDPEAIREATGKASRNLGEEGKRKGMITTLPVALGQLQTRGAIRRVPVNGRLDQQRYQYALWKPNPLEGGARGVAVAQREMARRFFAWVGPATLGELQWFSGLGVRAVKELVASLDLVAAAPGSDRLLLPEDVETFRAFAPPRKPSYALVSSLDPITATRRDVRMLLDPADLERNVRVEKGTAALGGLSDLPSHAILDRGRLIGFWEYDVEAGAIVWAPFGAKDEALAAAVAETEAFVRDQLGDARAFSLDSPKSRAPRIDALRKIQ